MRDGSGSGTATSRANESVAAKVVDAFAERRKTHIRLLADEGDRELAARRRWGKPTRRNVHPAATLQYAASRLDGGRASFLAYARSAVSAHPEIRPFLDHYDGITNKERYCYTLDQLAQQANVTPRLIIEAVAGEAFEQGINAANLIAAHYLPAVVSESVKVAVTRRGVKDREMLMQHHGFLPVPKGTTINIQNIQKGSMSDMLPEFERSVVSLGDAARSVERLPEGDEGTIDVEPEEDVFV